MREIICQHFITESGAQKYVKEIYGDSTETKPTTGIVDGSWFMETNTGKVFAFNEKSGGWVEQFSFQS